MEKIPFKSSIAELIPPIKLVQDLSGHDPSEYDPEDADVAFKMEKDLLAYRTKLQYEIDLTDIWIDNCKAIQARALENIEGER